jgi:hypothetical protein
MNRLTSRAQNQDLVYAGMLFAQVLRSSSCICDARSRRTYILMLCKKCLLKLLNDVKGRGCFPSF